MALTLQTNAPQQLLNDFKTKINQGHVTTWRYNQTGDFTHTPDQFNGRAWMRPVLDLGGLRFNIIGSTGYVTTWGIYGIFHGRLLESFQTHCHDLFTIGVGTSKPTNQDVITQKAVA